MIGYLKSRPVLQIRRGESDYLGIIFNRWMDDLRFYVLFNSISVISGQWEVHNERLYAMELSLRLRRFPLKRGLNSVR